MGLRSTVVGLITSLGSWVFLGGSAGGLVSYSGGSPRGGSVSFLFPYAPHFNVFVVLYCTHVLGSFYGVLWLLGWMSPTQWWAVLVVLMC